MPCLPESLKEIRALAPLRSKRNRFGVVVKYSLPDATAAENPAKIRDVHEASLPSLASSQSSTSQESLGPFPNKTGFLLAEWYWNSLNKSFADFQNLIKVFQDSDFSIDDAVNVNWRTAFKALGANPTDLPDDDVSWIIDDGWRVTPVSIDIPFHSKSKDPGTKPYAVGNFRH